MSPSPPSLAVGLAFFCLLLAFGLLVLSSLRNDSRIRTTIFYLLLFQCGMVVGAVLRLFF